LRFFTIIRKDTHLKAPYLKRFLYKLGDLISTYLSFIFVIILILPWVNGELKLHNSTEILNFVEVFVLSSAPLSLLTFTYIAAMSDMHEKVKKSMIIAGEAYFLSTVQFIFGLGLLLLVNLIIDHFINPFNVTLGFSVSGLIFVLLFLIQFIGIYEVASALSKFLKGIFEIYITFRIVRRPRLYAFLKKR
jgi:hypothetical protein